MNLGLLGKNINYSKSPLIHNWWLKTHQLQGDYKLYDLDMSGAITLIKTLREKAISGLNITIPYKSTLFSLIEETSDLAKQARAINTLVVDKTKIIGHNTDILGCVDILKSLSRRLNNVTLFGAGGVAQAVLIALQILEVDQINIVCRSLPKVPHDRIKIYPWKDQGAALDGADLLINCTPLGLHGQGTPLLEDSKFNTLPVFMDFVYQPVLTPFLKTGLQAGAEIIDGLELLIRQAQHSFYLWTGIFPPITDDLQKILRDQV